jgi:hypothetical protein
MARMCTIGCGPPGGGDSGLYVYVYQDAAETPLCRIELPGTDALGEREATRCPQNSAARLLEGDREAGRAESERCRARARGHKETPLAYLLPRVFGAALVRACRAG